MNIIKKNGSSIEMKNQPKLTEFLNLTSNKIKIKSKPTSNATSLDEGQRLGPDLTLFRGR